MFGQATNASQEDYNRYMERAEDDYNKVKELSNAYTVRRRTIGTAVNMYMYRYRHVRFPVSLMT